MYKDHRISLVMPCYNEENGLREVFRDLPSCVDEVVVVDNNSTDCSSMVAHQYGAIVVSERKQGYGAAYKAGLARASGDIIVTMDSDGTYPRNFIPILLDVMIDEGFDFITCDRTGHKDKPSNRLRIFGNDVLNLFIWILFWFRVRDSQSGMWVFRRWILQHLNLTNDDMAFSEEIKLEAMSRKNLIRSKELPIYYKERYGTSKLHIWRHGFANLFFLFRKRFGMLGQAAPLLAREPGLQKEPNA